MARGFSNMLLLTFICALFACVCGNPLLSPRVPPNSIIKVLSGVEYECTAEEMSKLLVCTPDGTECCTAQTCSRTPAYLGLILRGSLVATCVCTCPEDRWDVRTYLFRTMIGHS